MLGKALGSSRDDIYITNAFKGNVFGSAGKLCRPKSAGKLRRPKRAELDDHLGILSWEIDVVEPDIILALGQRAACVLLPEALPTLRSPIGDAVADAEANGPELSTVTTHPVRVIPCWHPGFVLRGGKIRADSDPVTQADFDRVVRRFLNWP